MRSIGYAIAGFQCGCAWVDFAVRHGSGTSRASEIISLVLAFAVWTCLVWAD